MLGATNSDELQGWILCPSSKIKRAVLPLTTTILTSVHHTIRDMFTRDGLLAWWTPLTYAVQNTSEKEVCREGFLKGLVSLVFDSSAPPIDPWWRKGKESRTPAVLNIYVIQCRSDKRTGRCSQTLCDIGSSKDKTHHSDFVVFLCPSVHPKTFYEHINTKHPYLHTFHAPTF